jgi:hypothetical protein
MFTYSLAKRSRGKKKKEEEEEEEGIPGSRQD